MVPITGFLIGPISIWLGSGLGAGLAWLNNTVPLLFAVLIPMIYPFLVPLGLHWPLNALMLANISTLGYDFIQGPMGAWNFACFGATAGVLVIAAREKDKQMRQTATGALVAGLRAQAAAVALLAVVGDEIPHLVRVHAFYQLEEIEFYLTHLNDLPLRTLPWAMARPASQPGRGKAPTPWTAGLLP